MQRHGAYILLSFIFLFLLISPVYPKPAARGETATPTPAASDRQDPEPLTTADLQVLAMTGAFGVLFCLYFFPSFVALLRGQRNFLGILVANLFFGFNPIIWMIILFDAFSREEPPCPCHHPLARYDAPRGGETPS